MTRVASLLSAIAVTALATSTALAAPDSPPVFRSTVNPHAGADVPAAEAAAPDTISHIIYLNRCRNGCTFTKATSNDALSNLTQIGDDVPIGTQMTVSPWALSETVWDQYVTCMREVYGPYDVQIVTEDPGNVAHHEAVVAGRAVEMHKEGALGVAPLDSTTCTPKNNVISFTFANDHRADDWVGLCWTTAQESAHSFGLDHAFDCSDPMTYLDNCDGRQRFFRNKAIRCGEFSARDCICGSPTQNSHTSLLGLFGKGTDPAPPTVRLVSPMPGPVIPTFSAIISATDHRGMAYADLFINGWKWAHKEGAGPTFVIDMPPNLPDGVMDLQVSACNDLDICAQTAVVTVTRGDPCTDTSTCLTGQKCEAGKCFWDPPSSELGAACSYNEQCITGHCDDPGTGFICTEDCFGPPNDGCPEGFECSAGPGQAGLCIVEIPEDEGGCCSTGGDGRGLALNLGLGAAVGLLVVRRRRKAA